jgi:hypothetical protein
MFRSAHGRDHSLRVMRQGLDGIRTGGSSPPEAKASCFVRLPEPFVLEEASMVNVEVGMLV